MAGWRAENQYRRDQLRDLAGELTPSSGSGHPPRPRLGLTWQLRPYLSIRRASRARLRVYCAGAAGRYALLTSDGQVIRLDEGISTAAAAVMAACVGREPGESAIGAAAAVQRGP